MRLDNGDVSLVDVSLEECGLETMCSEYALYQKAGTLRAERVRVGRPNPKYEFPQGCGASAVGLLGISKWTDSTISDCSGMSLDARFGTHTIVRTSIVRSRPAWDYPTVRGEGGILTMIDSYIADCDYECLRIRGSTTVLRNTTLRNCSAREGDARPYIQFGRSTSGSASDSGPEAASKFKAELLTLELSCEEPSAALIKIKDSAACTAPLNVRGLRVVIPTACASTNFSSTNFSVFSDHVRPVSCSDDDYAPCDTAATCTEVPPLPTVPNLKTVNCSCEGVTFANPTATSPALAPYGFDPRTIGLPGKSIDFCVCPSPVKPQTTTKAAQVQVSRVRPPAAARRSRSVLHARPTSVASV